MKMRIFLAIIIIVVLLMQGAPASISARANSNSATTSLGIIPGVYQPPTIEYGNELNAFNTLVGKTHGIAQYYLDWSTQFNTYLQLKINSQMTAANRPVIMLAWGPAGGLKQYGCDRDYAPGQPIPWSVIIQGGCDSYIHGYAAAIKQRPERFLLKFAHEMNDGAWSTGYSSSNPALFVQMWRHVHDIFTAEGVTNVEWVWSPIYQSYPNIPENSLYNYYPGDAYVDWVGLSGFNYYNEMPAGPQPWLSFNDMFQTGLRELACRYAKPQMIHEMASIEDSQGVHSKAAWISDAYQAMQNYPLLRAVVWYNDVDFAQPSIDFRVTSNTAANGNVHALPEAGHAWTNAYQNALASSVYKTTLPSLAAATPPTTYCGTGETIFAVQPSAVLLERGQSSVHTLTGMLFSSTTNLSLSLPANLTGSVTPNQMTVPWGKAQINLQTSASTPLGIYTVTVHAGSVQLPIQVIVVDSIRHTYLPFVIR
jgi:hypothetical protein